MSIAQSRRKLMNFAVVISHSSDIVCGLKSVNSNLRNNISVVYNRKKFGILLVKTIQWQNCSSMKHFIFVLLRTIVQSYTIQVKMAKQPQNVILYFSPRTRIYQAKPLNLAFTMKFCLQYIYNKTSDTSAD